MRACTVVLGCIAVGFLLGLGVGMEEETDALIDITMEEQALALGGTRGGKFLEVPTKANKPFTTPLRDYENIDAHTSDAYNEKIGDYEVKLANEKNMTSKRAIKYQSVINDLELSRAEACKKVLQMNGLPVDWKVEPKIDSASGHTPGGYDSPMVPLRKLLAKVLSFSEPTVDKDDEASTEGAALEDAEDEFNAARDAQKKTVIFNMLPLTQQELGEVVANSTSEEAAPTYTSMAAQVEKLTPSAKEYTDNVKAYCKGEDRWLPLCQENVEKKAEVMGKIRTLETAMQKESRVKEECIPFMASLMDRKKVALTSYYAAAKDAGLTKATTLKDYHPEFSAMSEQYFKDLKNETYMAKMLALSKIREPMPVRYGGVPDYKSPNEPLGPDRRGAAAEADHQAALAHAKKAAGIADNDYKELMAKSVGKAKQDKVAFQKRIENGTKTNEKSDNEQNAKIDALGKQYDHIVEKAHMPHVEGDQTGLEDISVTLIEEDLDNLV